jgi:hypothetical protein
MLSVEIDQAMNWNISRALPVFEMKLSGNGQVRKLLLVEQISNEATGIKGIISNF